MQCYSQDCTNGRAYSRFTTDFSIVDRLGKGGEATVYSAVHRLDQKIYAVKRVRFPLSVRPEMVINECQLMVNLEHPNVVRYHTSWVEFDFPEGRGTDVQILPTDFLFYVQMELCSEASFADHCKSMDRRGRVALIKEVCAGVQYLHSVGVIHRDLKPSNILIGLDGRPKIVDFGISVPRLNCAIGADKPIESSTPMYASPEHCDAAKLSTAVDVYSLGVIMMVVLGDFGTRMEECKAVNGLKKERVLPSVFETMEAEIGELILAMTEVDPMERPSAVKVLESLEAIDATK
jgi:serine/threonine protein kinase